MLQKFLLKKIIARATFMTELEIKQTEFLSFNRNIIPNPIRLAENCVDNLLKYYFIWKYEKIIFN